MAEPSPLDGPVTDEYGFLREDLAARVGALDRAGRDASRPVQTGAQPPSAEWPLRPERRLFHLALVLLGAFLLPGLLDWQIGDPAGSALALLTAAAIWWGAIDTGLLARPLEAPAHSRAFALIGVLAGALGWPAAIALYLLER